VDRCSNIWLARWPERGWCGEVNCARCPSLGVFGDCKFCFLPPLRRVGIFGSSKKAEGPVDLEGLDSRDTVKEGVVSELSVSEDMVARV